MSKHREHVESLVAYMFQRLDNLNQHVDIVFVDDTSNAQKTLGKTAHYQPQSNKVTVYTTSRHPKDCMRSLAHEIIHHLQNCEGRINVSGPLQDDYAQKDEHLNDLEREAYEKGNIIFRAWEDQLDTGDISLKEQTYSETIHENFGFHFDI